jgi:hypothetical protein
MAMRAAKHRVLAVLVIATGRRLLLSRPLSPEPCLVNYYYDLVMVSVDRLYIETHALWSSILMHLLC